MAAGPLLLVRPLPARRRQPPADPRRRGADGAGAPPRRARGAASPARARSCRRTRSSRRPGATWPSPTTASSRRCRRCAGRWACAGRRALHRNRAAAGLPLRRRRAHRRRRAPATTALEALHRPAPRLGGRAAPRSSRLMPDRIARARAAFETRARRRLPTTPIAHVGMANACAMQFETTRADESPDARRRWPRRPSHAREACRLDPRMRRGVGDARLRPRSHRPLTWTRWRHCGRAVSLEPDNWRHHFRLSLVSWGEARLRAARRTLALLPGLPLAHWLAATVHVARQTSMRPSASCAPACAIDAGRRAATRSSFRRRARVAARPDPAVTRRGGRGAGLLRARAGAREHSIISTRASAARTRGMRSAPCTFAAASATPPRGRSVRRWTACRAIRLPSPSPPWPWPTAGLQRFAPRPPAQAWWTWHSPKRSPAWRRAPAPRPRRPWPGRWRTASRAAMAGGYRWSRCWARPPSRKHGRPCLHSSAAAPPDRRAASSEMSRPSIKVCRRSSENVTAREAGTYRDIDKFRIERSTRSYSELFSASVRTSAAPGSHHRSHGGAYAFHRVHGADRCLWPGSGGSCPNGHRSAAVRQDCQPVGSPVRHDRAQPGRRQRAGEAVDRRSARTSRSSAGSSRRSSTPSGAAWPR